MSQTVWSLIFAEPPSRDDGGVGVTPSSGATVPVAPLSDSDAQMVRRIMAGDKAAFESLFHAEYQGLVLYLVRRTGTAWDAEELVQGVFVQLWERHETFAPRTSVRTYLYGAVRNAALNHFRAARRPLPPQETASGGRVSPADTELELNELERAAVAAVAQLPSRAREVWTLHREQGLTIPEVAAHLGISPNTVKTQLARSLVVIRRAVVPFLGMLLMVRP